MGKRSADLPEVLISGHDSFRVDCGPPSIPAPGTISAESGHPRNSRSGQRVRCQGVARQSENRVRIASPEMFLDAELLPRLICSRLMFIGGVKDEADQHGGTRR